MAVVVVVLAGTIPLRILRGAAGLAVQEAVERVLLIKHLPELPELMGLAVAVVEVKTAQHQMRLVKVATVW
jgi:hypothetical protein